MHVTASGAIDWAIQAGGASFDRGYGIAHDGAEGALVTGYFYGNASFGSTSFTSRGMHDAFVMHVTASGAIDWAIQAGGTFYDRGYGIAHDGAGGALVTGDFYGKASFGSKTLTTSQGTAASCFVASVVPVVMPVVPGVPGGECNGDSCDGLPPGLPPLPGGAPSPSRAPSPSPSPSRNGSPQPPASPFYQPPAVTVPEQPAVAALTTSLALLGLLLACFYRRHYRRLALLDRYRWPHDAKRAQVMCILRKTLEAVAELRTTSDAAVRGSESMVEARLILNHSHERLIRTVEGVLDEHATRADPTLVLGQNLFVAVSRVAQAQEQENVHRLKSRHWPSLHSRVQTVFAEAEARAKAAVKAEAKAKAKVAEEVAMATAKAAAEAEADADAETAKAAAKEVAEEANRYHRSAPLAFASLKSSPQAHTISPPLRAGPGGGGQGGGDESQALT